MNMGILQEIFTYLNSMLIDFSISNVEEPTSEFLIPTVVNSLMSSNEEKVKGFNTESSWFGVTYKKDKDYVEELEDLLMIRFTLKNFCIIFT